MTHLDPFAADVVRVVVGVGTVVVLPLGIRLLGDRVVPQSRLWAVAGLFAAVAVWLPVGPVAALVVAPFALACLVLAACALRAPDLATTIALVTPAIGAAALVAERAGWGLLGFGGDYLALTVPHMLFAGFGACLITGLVTQAVPGPAARLASSAVPLGVLLVLVGYFVSDAAELAGATVLTVGLWAAAAATIRVERARGLLRTGVVTVVVSMLLALWWALGEATDVVHPTLSWMAVTHGVANAFGFVLCTLVGLRLVPRPAPTGLTYTEVGATKDGPLPAGYRTLHVRHLLGRSSSSLDARRVGEALLGWDVHAAAHVRLEVDAPLASPGVHATTRLGLGPVRLSEPCAVVWVERTPERTGFGYGTLPGHLFRGEEAFTVEHDDAGDLWFAVTAFSVPVVWWARAIGPLTVVGQHVYLRLLAHGARTVLRAGVPAGVA
ncbi:YndJ family transporter [Cellulomonas sp. URHD0024]|uniref:YndJ family transporter n=1 Tax=Cellulomonas sp. URHD0024 TaxID=1302620 RepID=UPI000409CFF4|nr:YndJ family transporter [Cellulomonas sp. URHD0024]